MDDSHHRAVFELTWQVQPEAYSCVQAEGIDLDPDAVGMKKGITVLLEEFKRAVTFLDKFFDRENVLYLQLALFEVAGTEISGQGVESRIKERVDTGRFVFFSLSASATRLGEAPHFFLLLRIAR